MQYNAAVSNSLGGTHLPSALPDILQNFTSTYASALQRLCMLMEFLPYHSGSQPVVRGPPVVRGDLPGGPRGGCEFFSNFFIWVRPILECKFCLKLTKNGHSENLLGSLNSRNSALPASVVRETRQNLSSGPRVSKGWEPLSFQILLLTRTERALFCRVSTSVGKGIERWSNGWKEASE